ncbi:FG-GAP-like repeat-containing protein [Mesorhizobium sp.]|uniref:FG-GAP-like repeat-containing protein n=1 Tax=Mesorhizobium sp. TaxID=1871066 RepID=UPI0025D3CD94|nr:FG-GAP-like repeat-containing protein [Mesorhizobium sp.]
MIQTVVFIGQYTTWADISYDIVLPSSFVNSLDFSYLTYGGPPTPYSTQAFATAQEGGGGSGLPLTTVVSGLLTYQTDVSYAGDGQWQVDTYWARTGDPIYAVEHFSGNDQDGYQITYSLNLAPSSYDGVLPYEDWIDKPLVSFITDNTQIVSTTTSYQDITLTDHSEELILEGPARVDAGGGVDRISLTSGASGSTIVYTSLAELTGAALTDGLYGDNNAQPFEQIIGFASPDAGAPNRIDLSALSGFTYIGSGSFSATGHAEVRFEADAYTNDPEFAGQWGGWSLLQFDANGDGQIDYRLGLQQSWTSFQMLYETAPGSLVLQTNPPDVSADQPPLITSDGGGETAAVSIDENTAAVTTVTATDPDPGDTLTFSIAGGADAALFKIDGQTGELSFIDAPDYEKPKDAGLDNVYDVTVHATDASGSFGTQDISVTVNDVVGITASGDGVLIGTNEEDTLIGGSGSTRFVGNAGNDYMDGGQGIDTVDYGSETGPNGVYVNLLGRGQYTDLVGPDGNPMAPDTAFDTWGDLDTVTNIRNVIGTAHDDVIYGGNHDNDLQGGAGDDILLGGGRDDAIDGGDGVDTAIYRGNRSDYTVTANADGSVTITDLRPDIVDTVNNIRNDGVDTVRNVESFQFADAKVGFSDLLSPPSPSAPQVTADLAHDTGSSSSDGVTGDPTLAGTGDANAVVSFTLNGNPTGWTTTADANGAWTFTPTGLADGSYTIEASETNSGGTGTASLAFTLDGTRPMLTGIDPMDPTTTNASTVHYIVTFSEPVTGVDASQFSLAASGLAGASITGVEPVSGGNGTQYVVTVDTGSGDGTLAISLVPGAAIQDFAGNGLAGGPVSFSTPVSYATGYVPTWGAIGDVNGDGNADLVLPNYYAGTVGVYLGAGDGTLGIPVTYSSADFSYGFGSSRAYLADVNGDGSLDIVTANYSDGSISVLLNDGSGGYQARTAYYVGSPTVQVAIADIDGNGSLDLLASSDTGIVKLLGNGDGTFQPQQLVTSASVDGDIALTDVNGDGRADLLVVNGATLAAFINDGSGQFSAGMSYSLPYAAIGMAAGDLNGDGNADVVAADHDSRVFVLLGDGNGGFGPAAVYSTSPGVQPFSPVLAEMNGDGRLDVVLSGDTYQIGVLINNGDGTFGPVQAFPAGYADRVTVGDLNNDGLPDVVAGNYFSNTATVLLNASSFGGVTGPAYSIDHTAPKVTAGLEHDTGSSSSDSVTNDPTLTGTSDPNAVISFTLNGNATDWTTTADANGAWTFTPTGLANGASTIVASEADAAGNVGSASLTFTLDTTPPPATEALVSDTGASASDRITSNPALTGSGDPNAVVHFMVDGDPVDATATAGASGAWTFTPTGLANGSHTVVASETDAAGNLGTASLSFVLDTSAPIVADVLQTQVSKKLLTTTMSGHSEAGDVITLYEGTKALGSATAGADGKWAISLANLSNAVHAFTTTDLAGNSAPTVIFGTSGADKLAAPATGGIVIGGAGADTLAAGAGSDDFLFHSGFGKDTITGFDVHHDSLVFGADLPLFGSFGAVMAHVSDYSTKKAGFVGAVITYDNGDTITLAGVHAADLTPESFHFIQSDFWV